MDRQGFGDENAIDRIGDDAGVDTQISIGGDERRMHVRAYNHWASLLGGRAYPSIEDLDPREIEDFGPHSVLIDFTAGADSPSIAWLGRKLRNECGLNGEPATLSEVPPRSLLSRLTDHYLQIIANRAPIGFEAEFVSGRGVNTLYRGILMPYSSDHETIDFIYGVINWKELAEPELASALRDEVNASLKAVSRATATVPVWADGPHAEAIAEDDEGDEGDYAVPDGAGLADWLVVAREGADAVKTADSRSRAALYRALGLAYDFALVAESRPHEYAELLDDSGMKAQARAPMTPIVKLVFGVDYDKARLTEFAAALAFGRREGLAAGAMRDFLERYKGGLKAMVKAEREARAPAAPRPSRIDEAFDRMRKAEPKAILSLDTGDDEFVILIARRLSGNAVGVLGPVADAALVENAIRRARF